MSDLTLLHVGLHKTASTSFQITCRNNRQALAQSGFNYPNLFDLNGGKRTANHSCALFNLFSGSRLNYHLNAGKDVHSIERDVSIYKRILLAELFKDGNLILSGEDVSALNSQGQDRLAIYLAAFSRILKTFAVIRSPYSRHCSEFAGMISNGRVLRPTGFRSQVRKINRLKVSFCQRGNIEEVRFIPFQASLKSPQGPTRFLLEAMGVHNVGDFEVAVANEGLSNVQVRQQMSFNARCPRITGRRVNRNWRRVGKIEGPKFLLTKKELDSIRTNLLAENEWFEENLGKEFCDTSFPTCD